MSDQSQTATNKQSESALCVKGCGFFGNATTGGCCSKCWRDVQNAQKTKSAVAACVLAPSSPEPSSVKHVEKVAPLPLVVDDSVAPESATAKTKTPKSSTDSSEPTTTETPAVTTSVPSAAAANAPAKKKKKKKTSYKNMMANMMKEKSTDRDTAKDDAIRKVTGGGNFSKIDKI